MMSEKTRGVRIGVVGTSWWAERVHLPSLTSHPRAEVVAVSGRDAERAEAVAHRYGIPHVYTDYRAMISQAQLDALVISTPDDLHHPIACAALDAGLHVLCEKPLALNSTQAREMTERARAKNLTTMTFFTWRWMPQYGYLKYLADSGYAGALRHAQFTQLAGYGRSSAYAWRFDGRRACGVLGDLGSHMIDLARWLAGDIVRVSAHLATHVRHEDTPEPANDAALLLLEFAGGAQGLIHVSAVAQVGEGAHLQRTTLNGALGTLEVEPHISVAHVSGVQQGDLGAHAMPVPESYWEGVGKETPFDVFTRQSAGPRAFVDAVYAGRAVAPDFRDGWQAQAVSDAAFASHRSGRWEAVEDYL